MDSQSGAGQESVDPFDQRPISAEPSTGDDGKSVPLTASQCCCGNYIYLCMQLMMTTIAEDRAGLDADLDHGFIACVRCAILLHEPCHRDMSVMEWDGIVCHPCRQQRQQQQPSPAQPEPTNTSDDSRLPEYVPHAESCHRV
jgi:hypothetical protein